MSVASALGAVGGALRASAAFAAVTHLAPVALPFLSPLKGLIAGSAYFWSKAILDLCFSHMVTDYVDQKNCAKP